MRLSPFLATFYFITECTHHPHLVKCDFNSSIWKVEEEGSGVQMQPQLSWIQDKPMIHKTLSSKDFSIGMLVNIKLLWIEHKDFLKLKLFNIGLVKDIFIMNPDYAATSSKREKNNYMILIMDWEGIGGEEIKNRCSSKHMHICTNI